MAGGVPPKSAATRQRRNRKSTAATLVADPDATVPEIPDDREWRPETLAEWEDIWTSPMATEFIPADYYGVLKLAVLINDFWEAESPSMRTSLAVEIRLQRADFGLTPIARARLHWEVDRGEKAAEEKTKRARRQEKPPTTESPTAVDPRRMLGAQGGLVALPGGKL